MIDPKTLQQLVDVPGHPAIAANRIGRYYCIPMKVRGECTTKCSEKCEQNIANIVERINSCKPRDVYALLVWSAQTEVAN